METDKIVEQVRLLERKIEGLIEVVTALNEKDQAIGDWIPSSMAKRIAKLGKTSLYKMREAGKLSDSTISGKMVFYRMSDFERILNENENKR